MNTRSRTSAGAHRGVRRGRAAVLLVAVAALLAGCVSIPTSGTVGIGVEGEVEQSSVEPLGDPPPQDGTPEDIVQGFLGASAAGFSRSSDSDSGDDFRNAREYLSGETRRSWNPRESVVVYPTSSSPTITLKGESQVQVSVRVSARIDEDGRYSAAGADAEEVLTFDLVQDSDGQWRISTLEDGVVLSEPNFEAIYRSSTLYFLSPDDDFLVPETRWFPTRNLATSIVRALLAGPSDWLRDAVSTAIPEDATLQPDAVSVDDDGVATVSLAAGGLPSEPDDRALMQAQIEASLRNVRGVRSVEVTAGDVPLGADASDLERGQDWGGELEAIQGDTLVELDQGELVPVADVTSLAGLDASSPARDGSGTLRVMLSGTDKLVTVPTTDADSRTLLSASALVAPSVDRLGWVWTASTDTDGALIAVNADGQQIAVAGDWLAGRTVLSLRVARDATRIAVVSTGSDGVRVDVAAIVRDDSGTPQAIGTAWRTGVTLVDATRVVWVDESTLGVLGLSGSVTTAVYHLVPVAGQVEARAAIADTDDIAGGKGDSTLYLSTTDGRLFGRSGSSWELLGTEVSDPSFPG
ncbi:MAG TPA: LpqB family beta-propeller domain-containing protein [Cellulomonas sp.]